MRSHTFTGLVLAVSSLLLGCKKDEIQVYQAPKDAAADPARDNAGGAGQPGAAQNAAPPWKVPDGWQEKPSGGGMRIATYGVSAGDGRSLDISVVALGPEAGGELENVNRWRGQLELKPISADELTSLVKSAPIGRIQGRLVDIVSDKPTLDGKYKARLIVASLALPDKTVFFKMVGEDALAQENREKFLAWIRSVDTGDTEPPAGHPPMPAAGAAPMAGGVAPPPSTETPQWAPPAAWRSKPGSSMRIASFDVPGEGGESGDLSVIALGPVAGDMLSNINRWRGQVGLAPVDAAALPSQIKAAPLDGGGTANLVELTGEGPKAGSALLAAIVARDDRTWFYKLTGSPKLVARERENFVRFVASVKYP